MHLDRGAVDRNPLDPEVFENRLIGIGLLVQRYADLIDDLVAAALLDRRLTSPASERWT